jgi:hypothetical protein
VRALNWAGIRSRVERLSAECQPREDGPLLVRWGTPYDACPGCGYDLDGHVQHEAANVAQGPQQVNNGVPLARVGIPESLPNELLEAHGEGLDTGAADSASSGNPALAPVGTIHWPPQR